jgi:ribosomal protein S27E
MPGPVVLFQGKGEKSMKVKCISCGNELNLDHWVFEDYSGPVKCFSCSTMMEISSSGGEVHSVNPLPVPERHRGSAYPREERL